MAQRSVSIRLLKRSDLPILERVAGDTFDHAITPELAAEFLNDSRHHLVVALYASCGGSEGDDDLTMFSFPL